MRYIKASVIGGAATLLLFLPSEISRFVAAIALAVILGEVVFPHLVAIFQQDMTTRRNNAIWQQQAKDPHEKSFLGGNGR